jgi:LytS/YehU family sensor histidine kinase
VLLAPWVALISLVRQKDVLVRSQAVALERQATESRLQLLQSQVQPHFLFNTLANIRELVQSGSPQAPAVLDSLIAYLRAAVPRLHGPVTTLAQELELARAYLELMQMRMPDRLQYAIDADEAAFAVPCPPLTLLTLVENAVRHGIDPAEKGGRIDVRVSLAGDRCRAEVRDTGVGLRGPGGSLGTGLAALRERLQLAFGHGASLRVEATPPGVTATVEFPRKS